MDRLRLYSTTKGNFHPRWDYPRFLHQFSPSVARLGSESASAWRYARKRAERNPETIPIMSKYLYERKCIEFALGSGVYPTLTCFGDNEFGKLQWLFQYLKNAELRIYEKFNVNFLCLFAIFNKYFQLFY